MEKIKIQTRIGKIIGKTDAFGVSIFKGIPCAQQPVGERRWLPPEPLKGSREDIEAFDFGKTAVQAVDPVEEASLFPQGEDCLILNIWVKYPGASERPVMVFIHGGSCMSGGTTDPLYNGYRFAADHDVVFVTINYRLSLLGFLSLEEVGGTAYRDSGKLGILDQIAALQWIRENISAFGGDPENVTIFGESCGAGSVSLLMTTPSAKGLFHKVIAQSGSVILRKGPDVARIITRDFMRKVNCRNMNELLRVDTDTIRKVMDEFQYDYGFKYSIMFAPEVDGSVIPREPFLELEKGCAGDIRLMIGTNADEFNYWKLYFENTEEIMPSFLADQLFIMGLVLHYQQEKAEAFMKYRREKGLRDNWTAFTNEALFRLPAIRTAEIQSRYNDTYMYYFAWPSAVPGLGSCHALELPFVFNTLDCKGSREFAGDNPPKRTAQRMQKTWVAFASAGNPNNPEIPVWEPYNMEKRKTMIIDNEWKQQEDPEGESRRILEAMYR